MAAVALLVEGVLHGGAQVAAAPLVGQGADGGDAGDRRALAVEPHREGPCAEGGGHAPALEDAGGPVGLEPVGGVAFGEAVLGEDHLIDVAEMLHLLAVGGADFDAGGEGSLHAAILSG